MKNKVHKINGFVYVTSDEKPKENQYGIGYAIGIRGVGAEHYLFFHDGSSRGKINAVCEHASTIILTNNNALIDVQKLTLQEVEYLNTVDECDVQKLQFNPVFDEDDLSYDGMTAYYSYKIIIPKQETKQLTDLEVAIKLEQVEREERKQETIEAMADEYSSQAIWKCGESWKDGYTHALKTLYSEEEVLDLLELFDNTYNSTTETPIQWFNQNKKK